MAEKRRIYIDSCSFIEMVKVAVGKSVATERESDVWHLKRLLEASRDGEIEAYTSVITIAECIHIGDVPISSETKDVFSDLLMSGQYVRLVQTTPFIAEDARDLRWRHGISAKGADGIHVASALDRKCEEFLTTNGRLQRLMHHFEKISQLGLRVVSGRDTQCLPENYRQLALVEAPEESLTRQAPKSGMH